MRRRSFLKGLATLPFLGWLKEPKTPEPKKVEFGPPNMNGDAYPVGTDFLGEYARRDAELTHKWYKEAHTAGNTLIQATKVPNELSLSFPLGAYAGDAYTINNDLYIYHLGHGWAPMRNGKAGKPVTSVKLADGDTIVCRSGVSITGEPRYVGVFPKRRDIGVFGRG